MRGMSVIYILVLANNLPGIVDSVGVGAAGRGGDIDSGISARRERAKEPVARAVHPIKAHDVAEIVNSLRSRAGNPRGREVDGRERAAAQQKPVRALKRVVRVGEVVAPRNLAGKVDVAGPRPEGREGIID